MANGRGWEGTLHLPLRGFPESELLRGAKFFAGPFAGVTAQAIEMARRASRCGSRFFPARFEPAGFFQAYENGIESTRSETGLLAERVTVAPMRGMDEKRFEERKGLARDAKAKAHTISLHR